MPRAAPGADAIAHLAAADPVLAAHLHDPAFLLDPTRGGRSPLDGHFAVLLWAICGQQVSVASARAIHERLRATLSEPTPRGIAAASDDDLRAAGMSAAKIRTLRALAEADLDLDALAGLPDDDVVAALCALPGIGPWTAQVFLLHALDRPDVLAPADIGIRRAVMQVYGLDAMPSAAEVEVLAERWRPWRTIACRALWRSLSTSPAASGRPSPTSG
jgi:DNA-3-methyladenine glycosylase II